MARQTVGPRRTESLRRYVRATRVIGGLSVLVLCGAMAWDIADDGFWSRHALFTSLVASLIVVAVTAAVLNEVLERRQRERWAVLAQYALFEFVRTARLVWTGLLELAGLVPDGELGDGALAAGSEAVRDTPRLAAAMNEMLASADRREQLHRLIAGLLGDGQDVLGRWAGVMVNSGTYAEIVDRHVELYSRLYWWGSVLDESSLSRSIEARSNSRCGSSHSTGGLRSCLTDRRRPKICGPRRLPKLASVLALVIGREQLPQLHPAPVQPALERCLTDAGDLGGLAG
jgi:hypothetical protein